MHIIVIPNPMFLRTGYTRSMGGIAVATDADYDDTADTVNAGLVPVTTLLQMQQERRPPSVYHDV